MPHSNSSYTESINNSFAIQDKQLVGSYNVIDESQLGTGASGHSRRVKKQRSLSPRHSGDTGATNGRIYFEPEASPIPVKKRVSGGGGYQADNVMEEIQLSDLYIYDHGDGVSRGSRHQSPDRGSTYSVSHNIVENYIIAFKATSTIIPTCTCI